jgi:hypothetical protein
MTAVGRMPAGAVPAAWRAPIRKIRKGSQYDLGIQKCICVPRAILFDESL